MDNADNLVLFPSSKNFENFSPEDLGTDPLYELLNEFAHIEDDDIWDEDEPEINELMETAPAELPKFASHSELNQMLCAQMEQLEDLGQRLKYYLGEIELYIPEKRRK